MARPKYEIDPDKVRKLASDGAKVTEIADYFGVSREIVHARYHTELAKGRAELRASLRMSQVRAARDGNSTMLIWLGKQYLGQSDKTIDDFLMDAITSAGLTKEDLLELIQNKDAYTKEQGKKTFEDFCKASNYHQPFPKQIEMVRFGLDESVPRLLLGSRGYGKTDYITILGVAYRIYLDQANETNLIITKSKERNAAMLREIQQACMLNGVMFDRANATHLRAQGLHGKDHSVSAVTIKTVTLRGRHPKRVIMDDPVTEDDTREATRTHVERVYNEVMKLCQNVLIIGQPAHQYDLYAKLRGIIKTLEVPHGMIPELDHDLEAQRLAGVDEASISASYHLKVLSEGTSPFDAVKYVDKISEGCACVAMIDPSEGGDYTAVTILKGYMGGVQAVGFIWKRAWHHCIDDMIARFKQFEVKKLCFETNMTGDQPISQLRAALPGVGVVGKRSHSNKHARIMAAGVYAPLIHLSRQSDKLYLDHVTRYEYKAKFDDAPDSLAMCLEWVGLVRGKQ